MTLQDLQPYLAQIKLPSSGSHKGQNGKVMVVGGSELFHAASQWSLLVVSRMVDMVFYSSVPINNDLIKEAKEHFHNGIVVPRENIDDYMNEADVVLIGPGMDRSTQTEEVTNELVAKYPEKKWVIDAGALQLIAPELITSKTIITPHQKEFIGLQERMKQKELFSSTYPFTIILKGEVDQVMRNDQTVSIKGGNVGMTKGGTGDVLAGLVAGLYAFTDDTLAAAIVASYVNKQAGDELYESVGPFFNATDLADQIPRTLKHIFKL